MLNIENYPPIPQPTLAELRGAVESLRSSGPSFMILEKPHGYLQVGGSHGKYAVGCREFGEGFQHYAAGRLPPITHIVQVPRDIATSCG